jgi:hypothetical protein
VVASFTFGPNSSTGWHTHPGRTLVTVKSGTFTVYHAEYCEPLVFEAVGRPCGQDIPDVVVRQACEVGSIRIHDEDLGLGAEAASKDDLGAIGGTTRAESPSACSDAEGSLHWHPSGR